MDKQLQPETCQKIATLLQIPEIVKAFGKNQLEVFAAQVNSGQLTRDFKLTDEILLSSGYV